MTDRTEYRRKWRERNRQRIREQTRRYSKLWRKRQGEAYLAKDREQKRTKKRASWLARAGWTSEEYDRRHALGCGICGRHMQRLVFDHDHSTGRVRGLLCVRCNVKLEWALEFMARVREYVEP